MKRAILMSATGTLLLWAPVALAHPGRLDVCGGHTSLFPIRYTDSQGHLVHLPAGAYHFHRIPYETESAFRKHLRIDVDKLVILDCTTPDGVRHEGPLLKRGDHGMTEKE